jgi:hypothetical protein
VVRSLTPALSTPPAGKGCLACRHLSLMNWPTQRLWQLGRLKAVSVQFRLIASQRRQLPMATRALQVRLAISRDLRLTNYLGPLPASQRRWLLHTGPVSTRRLVHLPRSIRHRTGRCCASTGSMSLFPHQPAELPNGLSSRP